MRASAGRTNRWNVTIAETGLPGRPKTQACCHRGSRSRSACPGRSATPQKTCSTPSSASAGFTWSCGPTDTPPVTTTTSASSARSSAATVAAVVVAHGRRPARRPRRPRAPGPGSRSRSCCGSGPGPAEREAGPARRPSPPPRRAGGRAHESSATPVEAATPSSAGPRRVPGRQHGVARADVLARRAGSPCRAAERSGHAQLAVVLRPHPRRAARRRRRPGPSRRSRSRSPRRRRASPRTDGRRATRRPAAATTGASGDAAADVGGAQREPVHRRVVEPRHVVGARARRARARGRAPPPSGTGSGCSAGTRSSTAADGRARVEQAGCPSASVRRPYRLRSPRATASSALSVSRPLTFSGSFTASVAPSMARRGRPGALARRRRADVPALRPGRWPVAARPRARALRAPSRRAWRRQRSRAAGRLRGGRRGTAAALAGALRAALRKPAHDVGRGRGRRGPGRLPFARLWAGLGFAALPGLASWAGWRAWRPVGWTAALDPRLPPVVAVWRGLEAPRTSRRRPARPIFLAEPTATRLVWNSTQTHWASGPAASSRLGAPSSPEVPAFPGKNCPDSATFALETRINQ